MPNSRSHKDNRGGLLGAATRAHGGRKQAINRHVQKTAGDTGRKKPSPSPRAAAAPSSYAPSGSQSPVRSFYGAPIQEAGKARPAAHDKEQ